jgi:Uri superfamily endonuclease
VINALKEEFDSGIYLLEIFLHKPQRIEIGQKGLFTFPQGYYYYVGSAQKNLMIRIKRHQSKEKSLHWHIDYLLAEASLHNYFIWPVSKEGECKLASYLQNELKGEIIVKGFGASDCSCDSHLFYFSNVIKKEDIPDLVFFKV